MSSRIRLARNYRDVPFPSAMNEREASSVTEKTLRIFKDAPCPFRYVKMNALDQTERVRLMERHLISPEMVENTLYGAALISEDERVCVMIHEEDHLRIQVMAPGLAFDEAMESAEKLDGLLTDSGEIARDERFGYMTACLTNVGTGLRASAMMHLPGITMTRQLQPLADTLGKHALTMRGLYGEQSQAVGNLYQISNQATMGPASGEIVASAERAVRFVVDREREARGALFAKNGERMRDRLYRSVGTLKFARRLNTREFMALLSDLRLALWAGLVEGIAPETLNNIMITSQPAGLMSRIGRELNAQQRDAARADYVRSALAECVERKAV